MLNNLFLECSSRFLGGGAVPLECWYVLVVYRLNVCKVLSSTRESSSRYTVNRRVFHRDDVGFPRTSYSIVSATRDSVSD